MKSPIISGFAGATLAAWVAFAPVQAQAHDAAWCAGLQQTLAEIVREHDLPGATAAVFHPEIGACEAAAGFADAAHHVPMTPRHRLLAGSIGKTYVAAVAISLAQDGVLGLDQRAADWLSDEPWFAGWPNAGAVTIGQLLTHSSGVAVDYIERPELIRALAVTARSHTTMRALGFDHRAYAASVSGTAPAFEAGAGFLYTDVSYVLVALIIEKATGRPLEELVSDRFLRHLSLHETSAQSGRVPNLAAGYIPEPYRRAFGGLPEWSLDASGALAYDGDFEWGGGGYAATALDLARWSHAWFGGSAMGSAYLPLIRNRVTDLSVPTIGTRYGPGFQHLVDPRHGDRYFHRGYMLGYIAVAEYLPRYDIAVSLMINTIDPGYVAYHNLLVDFAAARIAARGATP